MTRKLMVAAVVLVGLVLIWGLLSWDPVEGGPEAEAPQPAADEPEVASADKPETPAAAPAPAPAQKAAPTPPAPAPAPAAEPQKPAEQDSKTTTSSPWPVPEKSGPIEEYKKQYDSEAIDSNAVAAESAIHTGFSGPAVNPALLDSVLCHTMVCRVRMRWTQERAIGFMGGLMHVITDPLDNVQFENNLAIDQPDEPNAAGERMVDVYLRLKAPIAR